MTYRVTLARVAGRGLGRSATEISSEEFCGECFEENRPALTRLLLVSEGETELP